MSGEAETAIGQASSKGGNTQNNTLDIQLIRIELGVAAQIKVGDSVTVNWQDPNYEVYFDSQRLGYVPGNYNTTLLPRAGYKGRLVRVAIYGDPIVIVRIHLPAN